MQMKNGCVIRERVLTAEIRIPTPTGTTGYQVTSSSSDVPPLEIRYPNSATEWQLRISGLTALPLSGTAERTFSYEAETKWFDLPFSVYLDERVTRPASVPTDAACLTDPGKHPRELWSTPIVSRWSWTPFGDRNDVPVNIGRSSPCKVDGVLGIHQHKDQQPSAVHPPLPSVGHGNHGYTVTRPNGVGEFALDANLHYWHDGFAGIFARVAYIVEEPDLAPAGFCVVPGTFEAPIR